MVFPSSGFLNVLLGIVLDMYNKDFDTWNTIKKKINSIDQPFAYHERDIRYCNIGTNIGFEEDGKGDFGERPVLVLKGFSKNMAIVLPLTTSKKKNKYYVNIGIVRGLQAAVIISQIRLIDTRRLSNKIAVLGENIFRNIRKAVRNMF